MVEKRPIDKLKIQGFKSLQDVELELGKLNVLIGPNGAGKSNLVSYFQMLREMVEERLQVWTGKQDGANRILTFGAKETPKISSHLKFGDYAYAFILEHTAADRFVFTDERLFYKDRYSDGFSIGLGHQESQLKSQIRSTSWLNKADYCYASISDWRVYHFHDTGDTALLKQTRGLHDNKYLRHDASNLAAYLFMLKHRHPEIYNEIRMTVQLAIPFFDDFVLEPAEVRSDEYNIQLQWQNKYTDEPFLASQLSDGSIRFICLVTALLQPDPPATIIFDEPELGLHPYAILLLGALIDSAAEDIQIIAATQSVPLLNEFSIDNLLVVDLEDGVSVFKRHDEKKFEMWLKDYSVGELWEKNLLGGGPL